MSFMSEMSKADGEMGGEGEAAARTLAAKWHKEIRAAVVDITGKPKPLRREVLALQSRAFAYLSELAIQERYR